MSLYESSLSNLYYHVAPNREGRVRWGGGESCVLKRYV